MGTYGFKVEASPQAVLLAFVALIGEENQEEPPCWSRPPPVQLFSSFRLKAAVRNPNPS